MSERPVIECMPDGPYVVRNLGDLRRAGGEPMATTAVVALCRCGGSANKPFCDGSHSRIGFSDQKLADAAGDSPASYRGRRITIHDNRSICAHAGICTSELSAVFKYGSEPWIDADAASVDAIIDTIRKCPSGALRYTVDDADGPDFERAPAITVTANGPYQVVGGVDLIDRHRGAGAPTEHYTLCRCGASRNKPFCDGSHWDAGFSDGTG
jgi:CDGSH-type Zn-finger protein